MTSINSRIIAPAMLSATGTRVRTNCLRPPVPYFFSFAMNSKNVAADVRRVHLLSALNLKFEPPHVGCYESSSEIAFGAADDFGIIHFELASVAQGSEVNNRRVAMCGGQLMIHLAGAKIAVLLVIHHETRNVAERKIQFRAVLIARRTARTHRAAAGHQRVAEQFQLRSFQRTFETAHGGDAGLDVVRVLHAV